MEEHGVQMRNRGHHYSSAEGERVIVVPPTDSSEGALTPAPGTEEGGLRQRSGGRGADAPDEMKT